MLFIKQLGRHGAAAALVVGLALCSGGAAKAAADADRVKTGFRISPVPLDLKGLNRDMVGLGSYIVNSQGGWVVSQFEFSSRRTEDAEFRTE